VLTQGAAPYEMQSLSVSEQVKSFLDMFDTN
jgi:hypothetical protein